MAWVLPLGSRRTRRPLKPVGLTSARLRQAAGDSTAARARNSLANDSASASTGRSPQRLRIGSRMASSASVIRRGV